MTVKNRIKSINRYLVKNKLSKYKPLPILGGEVSGKSSRQITHYEAILLEKKGLPIPIFISNDDEEKLKRLIY